MKNDEVLKVLADPRQFIETFLNIVDKRRVSVPFIFNPAQSKYYENRTQNDLILKARKEGFSSLIEALWLHACMFIPNTRAVILSHEMDSTKRHFDRIKYYLDTMGDGQTKFIINLDTDSQKNLRFPGTNSSFWIGTAGAKAFGRGDDITHLHLCLSGDSLVMLRDGFVKRIDSIRAGDTIWTHNQIMAPVIGLSKKRGATVSTEMREIVGQGLHHFPIKATPNHKLMVRGPVQSQLKSCPPVWKKSKDITEKDWLAIPRRSYKSKIDTINMEIPSLKRRDGRGYGRKPLAEPLKMDFNLGFIFGLYLAEGSIKYRKQWPVATVFTLDKDELRFVDIIKKRIGHLGKVSVLKRKKSRSVNMVVYNSSFARTIIKYLGEKETKRLPDYFWRAKRQFLDGIVKGYIDGDGYVSSRSDSITITSIRPQLITQFRDLLASLYYGWSSIYKVDAGVHYGRNCKEAWVLSINGHTALKLKQRMGWKVVDRERKAGRHWKYDRKFIYIKVLSNETIPVEDDVYDVVLDHPDHSFRLVSGISSNSEVAHYQNQDVLTSVMEACVPGAHKVMETTANGVGEAFYKLWMEAKDPKAESPWKNHFFAWFEDHTNRKRVPMDRKLSLAPGERQMRDRYDLDDEQIYWYRCHRKEMTDKAKMPQEHPCNDREAFISSGRPVFTIQKLEEKIERAPPPRDVGDLTDDGQQIKFIFNPEGNLKVWKPPRRQQGYLICADVAEGVAGGNWSVAHVVDRSTWEQVAVVRLRVDPGEWGRMLCTLGYYYNNAVLVPELNNNGWATVEAIKAEDYPHLLNTKELWPDDTHKDGFPTNTKTRSLAITALRNAVDEDTIFFNDRITLSEMETFVQNEKSGKLEAQEGCEDDCVLAMAIGAYCLSVMTLEETYANRAKVQEDSGPVRVQSILRRDYGKSRGVRRRRAA